jgi:hypothetical protein
MGALWTSEQCSGLPREKNHLMMANVRPKHVVKLEKIHVKLEIFE